MKIKLINKNPFNKKKYLFNLVILGAISVGSGFLAVYAILWDKDYAGGMLMILITAYLTHLLKKEMSYKEYLEEVVSVERYEIIKE